MFPNSRLDGFGSLKRTWLASSTSIWCFEFSPTIENRNEPTAFTSKQRSRLYFTAAASIGVPSGNLIPFRISNTTSLPPLPNFHDDATWPRNCVDCANRAPSWVPSSLNVTGIAYRLVRMSPVTWSALDVYGSRFCISPKLATKSVADAARRWAIHAAVGRAEAPPAHAPPAATPPPPPAPPT